MREVIFDVEANGLTPDKIWVICAKDLETGEVFSCLRPSENPDEAQRFREYAKTVAVWIGHNILGYDVPVIANLLGVDIPVSDCIDTLVVSRLVNYNRSGGHSLDQFGQEAGIPKVAQHQWEYYEDTMYTRCLVDIDINKYLYNTLKKYIFSPLWSASLRVEHYIASVCTELHRNGFAYDIAKAERLYEEISSKLDLLTKNLQVLFPPRSVLLGEVTPRLTKQGTLSRSNLRFAGEDLTPFSADAPFSRIEFVPFNPGSPKQRVDRLWEAGWEPTDKSDGHKDFLKARIKDDTRLEYFRRYGWKTSEENLGTLPPHAPKGARSLVEWLLLSSRVSRLTEWKNAYSATTGRIHGDFSGIGAWTGRMSHSNPNMGNIPAFNDKEPEKTPYSDVMRSLWIAGKDRLLVGVDAESIQLRIFAHYLNDPEFTNALLAGRKEDRTDPHSVNQRALGAPCKSRDAAKTFIYAWLLGAGVGKVAEILRCSHGEAKQAIDNFIQRYPGLAYLKENVIPEDAFRGYFQGFDGRYVPIYGEDVKTREHYALAGYLQNGEKVIMARGIELWKPKLEREGIPFWIVNFVHDEYQTETINDLEVAKYIGNTQAEAIRQVGIDLGLRCPFAGSVNNSHGKLAVGINWMETH